MNLSPYHIAFCLIVLGMFSYGKDQGMDLGNTIPTRAGSSTSSGSSGGGSYGGSYHYTGTSGGSHK